MELFWWGVGGGLIGAAFGKHFRNKSGAGALLGLFLGPIGWGLVYFLNDNRFKCPQCLRPVLRGARKCGNCQSEINPSIYATEA